MAQGTPTPKTPTGSPSKKDAKAAGSPAGAKSSPKVSAHARNPSEIVTADWFKVRVAINTAAQIGEIDSIDIDASLKMGIENVEEMALAWVNALFKLKTGKTVFENRDSKFVATANRMLIDWKADEKQKLTAVAQLAFEKNTLYAACKKYIARAKFLQNPINWGVMQRDLKENFIKAAEQAFWSLVVKMQDTVKAGGNVPQVDVDERERLGKILICRMQCLKHDNPDYTIGENGIESEIEKIKAECGRLYVGKKVKDDKQIALTKPYDKQFIELLPGSSEYKTQRTYADAIRNTIREIDSCSDGYEQVAAYAQLRPAALNKAASVLMYLYHLLNHYGSWSLMNGPTDQQRAAIKPLKDKLQDELIKIEKVREWRKRYGDPVEYVARFAEKVVYVDSSLQPSNPQTQHLFAKWVKDPIDFTLFSGDENLKISLSVREEANYDEFLRDAENLLAKNGFLQKRKVDIAEIQKALNEGFARVAAVLSSTTQAKPNVDAKQPAIVANGTDGKASPPASPTRTKVQTNTAAARSPSADKKNTDVKSPPASPPPPPRAAWADAVPRTPAQPKAAVVDPNVAAQQTAQRLRATYDGIIRGLTELINQCVPDNKKDLVIEFAQKREFKSIFDADTFILEVDERAGIMVGDLKDQRFAARRAVVRFELAVVAQQLIENLKSENDPTALIARFVAVAAKAKKECTDKEGIKLFYKENAEEQSGQTFKNLVRNIHGTAQSISMAITAAKAAPQPAPAAPVVSQAVAAVPQPEVKPYDHIFTVNRVGNDRKNDTVSVSQTVQNRYEIKIGGIRISPDLVKVANECFDTPEKRREINTYTFCVNEMREKLPNVHMMYLRFKGVVDNGQKKLAKTLSDKGDYVFFGDPSTRTGSRDLRIALFKEWAALYQELRKNFPNEVAMLNDARAHLEKALRAETFTFAWGIERVQFNQSIRDIIAGLNKPIPVAAPVQVIVVNVQPLAAAAAPQLQPSPEQTVTDGIRKIRQHLLEQSLEILETKEKVLGFGATIIDNFTENAETCFHYVNGKKFSGDSKEIFGNYQTNTVWKSLVIANTNTDAKIPDSDRQRQAAARALVLGVLAHSLKAAPMNVQGQLEEWAGWAIKLMRNASQELFMAATPVEGSFYQAVTGYVTIIANIYNNASLRDGLAGLAKVVQTAPSASSSPLAHSPSPQSMLSSPQRMSSPQRTSPPSPTRKVKDLLRKINGPKDPVAQKLLSVAGNFNNIDLVSIDDRFNLGACYANKDKPLSFTNNSNPALQAIYEFEVKASDDGVSNKATAARIFVLRVLLDALNQQDPVRQQRFVEWKVWVGGLLANDETAKILNRGNKSSSFSTVTVPKLLSLLESFAPAPSLPGVPEDGEKTQARSVPTTPKKAAAAASVPTTPERSRFASPVRPASEPATVPTTPLASAAPKSELAETVDVKALQARAKKYMSNIMPGVVFSDDKAINGQACFEYVGKKLQTGEAEKLDIFDANQNTILKGILEKEVDKKAFVDSKTQAARIFVIKALNHILNSVRPEDKTLSLQMWHEWVSALLKLPNTPLRVGNESGNFDKFIKDCGVIIANNAPLAEFELPAATTSAPQPTAVAASGDVKVAAGSNAAAAVATLPAKTVAPKPAANDGLRQPVSIRIFTKTVMTDAPWEMKDIRLKVKEACGPGLDALLNDVLLELVNEAPVDAKAMQASVEQSKQNISGKLFGITDLSALDVDKKNKLQCEMIKLSIAAAARLAYGKMENRADATAEIACLKNVIEVAEQQLSANTLGLDAKDSFVQRAADAAPKMLQDYSAAYKKYTQQIVDDVTKAIDATLLYLRDGGPKILAKQVNDSNSDFNKIINGDEKINNDAIKGKVKARNWRGSEQEVDAHDVQKVVDMMSLLRHLRKAVAILQNEQQGDFLAVYNDGSKLLQTMDGKDSKAGYGGGSKTLLAELNKFIKPMESQPVPAAQVMSARPLVQATR